MPALDIGQRVNVDLYGLDVPGLCQWDARVDGVVLAQERHLITLEVRLEPTVSSAITVDERRLVRLSPG